MATFDERKLDAAQQAQWEQITTDATDLASKIAAFHEILRNSRMPNDLINDSVLAYVNNLMPHRLNLGFEPEEEDE